MTTHSDNKTFKAMIRLRTLFFSFGNAFDVFKVENKIYSTPEIVTDKHLLCKDMQIGDFQTAIHN